GPFERLLDDGEGPEQNGFVAAKLESICEMTLAPFRLVLEPHPHMDKDNDSITRDDIALRLASSLRPPCTMKSDVCLHGFEPFVDSRSWEIGWLDTLDVGSEYLEEARDIVSIERFVGCLQRFR